MAWSYDNALSTDKDRIRLMIGDTLCDVPILSDEEIEAVLEDEGDDLLKTAEEICRFLSARFGREAEIDTGVIKDKKGGQSKFFYDLAEKYRSKRERAGLSLRLTSESAKNPTFTRHMDFSN